MKIQYLITVAALGALAFFAGCQKDYSTVVEADNGTVIADTAHFPFILRAMGYIPAQVPGSGIWDSVAIGNVTAQIDSFEVVLSNTDSATPLSLQYLRDDGKNGDVKAHDSVFTAKILFTGVGTGARQMTINAIDHSGKKYFVNRKQIEIFQNDPPVITSVEGPDTLVRSDTTVGTLKVMVTDPQGVKNIASVFYKTVRPDGTSSGKEFVLADDGIAPDAIAGDGIYTGSFQAPVAATAGTYKFLIQAKDIYGELSTIYTKLITLK
ncbi:MAG: hypothetical protein LWX56_06700 [Ignavibacteria bacterium]|nr:hypothetical protein [Ignavibacteria bacterium]